MTTSTRVSTLIALLTILSCTSTCAADDTVALKPGKFLKQWMALAPSSAFEKDGLRTADAAKRKSFDADLLNAAGGEASIQPTAGGEIIEYSLPVCFKRWRKLADCSNIRVFFRRIRRHSNSRKIATLREIPTLAKLSTESSRI